MSKPDRLYGLPDDEYLELTPEDVYERDIEPHLPAEPIRPGKAVETILEYTVTDNRKLLPSVDGVVTDIIEVAADGPVTEEWYEAAVDATKDEKVVSAFNKALDLLASKIRYWMADTVVAEHELTFDENGQPLLDGEPLYRPTQGAAEG